MPTPEPLYYRCQRCTNCCQWPGEVILTDDDILRIARHLELSPFDFVQRYTALRRNRQGLTLIEQPGGACVFLKGRDCAIQPVKPRQCAGFPNDWNFPGWREQCEAVPIYPSDSNAHSVAPYDETP